MQPKYPNVTVQLTGEDGNAFFIIGKVQRALRAAGVANHVVADYVDEATAGDYDHLLLTTTQWVNVE